MLLATAAVWPPAHAQSSPLKPASAGALPSTLEADHIEARPDQDAVATGHVDYRQGRLRIQADRLSYHQPSDTARATGSVTLSSDGNWFSGPEVQLSVDKLEGYFLQPTYYFGLKRAGGRAERYEFLGRERGIATQANYTSCQPDDPAWLMSAERLQLDFEKNEGIAEGGRLYFYGVPILAAPTFSFPLSNDRKSGLLPAFPDIDSKAGLQVSVPYYWNIAPNRDATITPAVSTKRGFGLETEFRYLEPSLQGTLQLHGLPDDRLRGRDRGLVKLRHEGLLVGAVGYGARITRVTDNDYWKDFQSNLDSLTPRLLEADLRVSRRFDRWTPYARVKRWQVLQDADTTQPLLAAPYDRLPQVGLRTMQPLPAGFQLGLETEYNQFVNPHGFHEATSTGTAAGNTLGERPTGSRTHALAALSWPYATPGWSFVPRLSLNAAAYSLDQPLAIDKDSTAKQSRFHRVIPSFSLDNAWVLERDADWFGRSVRQTLEPRLLYVNTPYRDQSRLPNFDSAAKDFNVDSIYTDNAFTGVDRVSDANQLTTGVTTRLLDPVSGAESMRLGMAQRFLFNDQQVTANDGPADTKSLSDVLLYGSSHLSRRWYLDAALQYGHEERSIRRSVVGARYTAEGFRTVSMAYRQKDGDSRQVDFAWQWPLYRPNPARGGGGACSGAWYSAGRVNYSLLESRVTGSVMALEYDSGCWIGRVMVRRQSLSSNEATTQVGLQLEFVGFTRIGPHNPLKYLKDNIPGYRPLRDDGDTSAAP